MIERGLFSSGEWKMSIDHSLSGEGKQHHYGDLFFADRFVCRIAAPGDVGNRIAAEVWLSERARKWISDYSTKVHSGATDFGELGEL